MLQYYLQNICISWQKKMEYVLNHQNWNFRNTCKLKMKLNIKYLENKKKQNLFFFPSKQSISTHA